MDFSRSNELMQRLNRIVPGGAHTYAKGPDQYPELSPGIISHGKGSHVWDADGNEFVEYGMGLRAVTLGHAYEYVVDRVRAELERGNNFTRPAAIELDCAERLLANVPRADMVKFTKDGSTATTAALKLARAATGRDMVAVCRDHPFFSYDDWFVSTTSMDGGVSEAEASLTTSFRYNDLDGAAEMFAQFPNRIAAMFLEPARLEPPAPGYLEGLRRLCTQNGTVLVFDEMITGFRYAIGGGQSLYDVRPDLSTWGKAVANGFAVSALCGTRELMQLGSRERPEDNVFLLSTTHGAESCSLAAAIATIDVYESEPVVEHLYRQGERLVAGIREAAARHGVGEHVMTLGFPCNLLFATLDRELQPSQAMRSLLLQETARRGVLMPSLVVSFSHSDADIDHTIEAIDSAAAVYAKALEEGPERFLVGRPSRVVYDRKFSAPVRA